MKQIITYIIGVAFGLVGATHSSHAQLTNIAPLATVTASTCNTGPCSSLNDLNYGNCGTQQMWISTANPPSSQIGVNYIEWNWPTTQFFEEMIIHHGQDNARFLTGALIQVWDNGNWVTHHHFTNLTMQCVNSITFPPVATDRMRITAFEMTGSGQTSNPNFREIEIIEAPPNDAGIHAIVEPGIPKCLSKDVYVTLETISIDPITNVTIRWSVNGANQIPHHWTGFLPGQSTTPNPIYLGDFNFSQGDQIKVWTEDPNGEEDKYPINDTLTFTIPNFNLSNMPTEELLCPGDNITLSTGVGFAAHQWSTGSGLPQISVNQGGIYRVKITDNNTGCQQDYQVNVIEDQPVNLPDTLVWGCEIDGGMTLQGNKPRANYLWSNGTQGTRMNVTQSGTYWVQATDPTQTCLSSDTVEVEIYDMPNPAFTQNRDFLTLIFINNTQDATSYLWDFGDGQTSTDFEPTHLYVQPGEYDVRLTAFNLCGQRSVTNTVGVDPVSVGDIENSYGLNIYPNPSAGLFNVDFNTNDLNDVRLEIMDVQGRLIQSEQLGNVTGNFTYQVNLGNVASGMYLVKIIIGAEVAFVERIVVE